MVTATESQVKYDLDFEFCNVDGKHNSVQKKAVAQYDHFISSIWRSESLPWQTSVTKLTFKMETFLKNVLNLFQFFLLLVTLTPHLQHIMKKWYRENYWIKWLIPEVGFPIFLKSLLWLWLGTLSLKTHTKPTFLLM